MGSTVPRTQVTDGLFSGSRWGGWDYSDVSNANLEHAQQD
jgi:hypothetical protein